MAKNPFWNPEQSPLLPPVSKLRMKTQLEFFDRTEGIEDDVGLAHILNERRRHAPARDKPVGILFATITDTES